MKVLVTHNPRPVFLLEERTGFYSTGGWVGQRAGVDALKERNLLPAREIQLRNLDIPFHILTELIPLP
jgi:hypothetical protein